MGEERSRATHPSFGMVSISRRQGESALFGVDYPQAHSMGLRISSAEHIRETWGDRYYATEAIIEIELSETQFAQLICGVGTEGVPCTIRHQRDIGGGMVSHPRPPADRLHNDMDYLKSDVAKRGAEAIAGVGEAMAELDALLDASGAIRKSDLKSAREKLRKAHAEMREGVPYAVARAQENITQAVENGRNEFNAHVGFAKQRLGEEIMVRAAARALQGGQDPVEFLLGSTPRDEEPVIES